MWLLEHKGTKIVVGAYQRRADAYDARRAMRYITTEGYRVIPA